MTLTGRETVVARPVRRSRALGLGAVALACTALSLGSTIVKESGSPGPVVAFWRLLLGSIVWMAIARSTGRTVDRRSMRLSVPLGALFGLNLCLFFTGAKLTRIAHAEFIGMLTPIIVLPMANRRFKERIDPVIVACGALALSGVALVLLTAAKGATHWGGNALIGLANLSWAAYLLSSKSVRPKIDTVSFMAGMTTAACVVAFPVALWTGGLTTVSAKGWTLIVVMALTSGTMAHGLLIWSQKHVPVSTMSLMQLGQPPMAATWAFIFLHESIRPVQLVGMAAVLGAVGIIAVRTARQ